MTVENKPLKPEKQYDELGRVIRANRSAIKRERAKIKELVAEIIKIPETQYQYLKLNAEQTAAFREAKRLKGNAFARHLSYLTRLIEDNFTELNKNFADIERLSQQAADRKKFLINQRVSALLNDEKQAIFDLLQIYPDADIQKIRQYLRAIRKFEQKTLETEDAEENKDKNCREKILLQQYLQDITELE